MERIWDAVEAWRWIPPSATRVVTDAYELAVTPGSYALSYVYGLRVDPPERVGERLDELRKRVQALGGTGARIRVTPRSRPPNLVDQLRQHDYRVVEEADVLVWVLRDEEGKRCLPEFPFPPALSVREVVTDLEYERFTELGTTIFGDPVPSDESRKGFLSEFHRNLREEGHSNRFLAWAGPTPIGRAGLELVGPVARFWGTGVLPDHRRRGVYGALVRARCELAAERGAEIALVTARVGTSGPILKRHGFQTVGTLRMLETRW